MANEEDITLRVVTETKGLQERINSSSLSKEDKAIASAKLSEALNLLSKGMNATAKDLSIASGNIKAIIGSLVTAAAGAKGVSKELKEAQAKLEQAVAYREELTKERSKIRRTQLAPNGGLRTAEANRQTIHAGVDNGRGGIIKTYDALKNAAQDNNNARVALVKIDEILKKYQDRLAELETTLIPNAERDVKMAAGNVSAVENSSVENSVAVKMQEFGNELQNLITKLKEAQQEQEVDKTANTKEVGINPAQDLENINKDKDVSVNGLGRIVKQFSLYAIALRTIKKAAREAITTITELDKSLTEQAMVTGMTREQTQKLLTQYQNLATQLGTTTKEVSGVMTEFIRQGKSVSDALVLTEAAISAAKVAGISGAESVNYLTTALNGFQLSANDASIVSDKFAAVAATSATNYEELAIALSKVASQANLAGMSIDYTTALLAKGIETTREAPETIGTALKTVIARMREMTDYGSTLEGDTDVNNVETQLAYVGIALKNANGELRSTEDVLDDLGKKWDTLNSNQQAAIAKALAGTRQQSRLIAMMSSYERVTELQQVSLRSAGATAAQMDTYMGGMEAAINKLNNAWEKIVTTITDSDVIVDIIDHITNALNGISEFLGTNGGLNTVLAIALTTGTAILLNKLAEIDAQRQINVAQAENNKLVAEQQKEEALKTLEKSKQIILDKQAAVDAAKALVEDKKRLVQAKKTRKEELQMALIKAEANGDTAKALSYKMQIGKIDKQIINAEAEVVQAQQDQIKAQNELDKAKADQQTAMAMIAKSNIDIANAQQTQLENLGGVFSIINKLIAPFTTLFFFGKSIASTIGMQNLLLKQQGKEIDKLTLKEKIKAAWSMASSAGAIPYVGFAIGLAILAAIGVGLAVNIARQNDYTQSTEKTSEKIQELGNEIYRLNESISAINNITSSYDKLDQQLIKTIDDQNEMNKLLDQAADKITDDDAKEIYKALNTAAAKRQFLDAYTQQQEEEIAQKRNQQKTIIRNSKYRSFFLNGDSTEAIKVRDQIYAGFNNEIYSYLDSKYSNDNSNKTSAVQSLIQSIGENLDAEIAFEYWDNPEKIQALTDSFMSLKTVVNETNDSIETTTESIAEVLTTEDYSLKDRVEAYEETKRVLNDNKDALEAFSAAYQQYEVFAQMDDQVLEFIDSANISIDKLNNFYTAYEKLNKFGLNISKEDFQQNLFPQILEDFANGGSVSNIIDNYFGVYLQGLNQTTDEYKKAYDAIVNIMDLMLGESILNIGQNMTKIRNTIDSFYTKASEWKTMSDSDKATFLSDNADLFKGEGGKTLLEAIQTSDYNYMFQALSNNEALKKKVQNQLNELNQQLDIENARQNKDYAAIALLEQQKATLEDMNNLYAASLEVRLEQEQKYLDEYKSYLEDQRDALKASLDKRKEAYSDYFDAVNQEAEDKDFEKQESTLMANIAKLSSSSSADSINQQAKLEQELTQLEEERLDTLRQRAQEQIISNIEDTIDEINDKFDDLLNSNQALLAAMTGELDNPSKFLSNLISNKVQQTGLTELGLQNYIQDLQSIYGSKFGNQMFDNISVDKQGDQLILNIAGTEVVVSDQDQQSIYEAIMTALKQTGYR